MTNKELYYFIFNKLEAMYFDNKIKYDHLGIILGQMSPETFLDSESADPAAIEDFLKILNTNYLKKNYSEDDGKKVARLFLEGYIKIGYNIKNILDDLENYIK